MNSANKLLQLKFESKEISSFFDCLSDILLKLSNGTLDTFPDFKKYFSKYLVCRYLSMKAELFPYAEYLNKIQYTLSNEQFYKLTYYLIPKQNSGFIKYIKKAESKKTVKEPTKQENKSNDFVSMFEL